MLTVSVIVPVFNTSSYLSRCIDSIINQTYRDIEIILIDDGSTDDSAEICKEYASIDSRILILSKATHSHFWANNSTLSDFFAST